jgi:hypothetical protein
MARKGDIDSKSVASRIPMEVYIRLLTNSSAKGETISNYVRGILTNEQEQSERIDQMQKEINQLENDREAHITELVEYESLIDEIRFFKGVEEVIQKHKFQKKSHKN